MAYFNKQEDIRPFFENQLEACGVEYFDFYLMHAQSKDIFAHLNLPDDAKKILDDLHGGSTASYAVRFAASFEGIRMVLSGMSNLEQMNDNLSYMKDFKPLDEKEMAAVKAVADVFHSKHMIPCTACRYCVDGCPKRISIPDLFARLNAKTVFHDWNADYYYNQVHTVHNGKAGACIRCGKFEKVCPQHLKIRELLKEVPKEFEK